MAHTMPKWDLLIWNEQPATSGWHPECDTSLDLSWCATFLMQGAILDDVVLKDLRHDRKCRLLRPLLLTGAVNLWHLLSSILSYVYIIDHISLQIRFLPTLPRSRSLCFVLLNSVLAHWCFIQAKWANQGVHHKSAARAFTKVKQILALSCQCKRQHPATLVSNGFRKRISTFNTPSISFPSLSSYFFRSKPAK